jgi:virulence activator alpha
VLAQAEVHRQRLAEYDEILAGVGPAPVDSPDFGSVATLRCGIGYERHRLQWCEWLAEQLQPVELA